MRRSDRSYYASVRNKRYLQKNILNPNFLRMTSSSSIDTPLVVEVSERERLQFKNNPFKSIEDDPNGAFASMPHGVLHVDDVRDYIHCNIEEIGNEAILSLYNNHL